MAKRFGDTDIWKKQRWFRKLSPNYKLAFCYIKDLCDHAGIWNIDCTDLIEDLGIETFDLADFIANCNIEYDKNTGATSFKERLRTLDKGYLWVIGFIQFQYKGKEGLVNPYANPVKTALQIVKGYGLLDEAISKGWLTLTEPLDGIADYFVRAKDKEKDKDINTLHNPLHNKVKNNNENFEKINKKNESEFSGTNNLQVEDYFTRRNRELRKIKAERLASSASSDMQPNGNIANG